MNLLETITEADLLVPNEVSLADKISWLNSLNQDFFNVVKIPRVVSITSVLEQKDYILPTDVRLKNIDLVTVGVIKYKEMLPTIPNPLQNTYTFDDSNFVLTLRPAPYQGGLQSVVRYSRIATTIFTSDNLNSFMDAPGEYHWTFIPGLASFIANAMDDTGKAATYESQYRNAWAQAATQYAGVTANV